jgi:hypothetical protein
VLELWSIDGAQRQLLQVRQLRRNQRLQLIFFCTEGRTTLQIQKTPTLVAWGLPEWIGILFTQRVILNTTPQLVPPLMVVQL